MLFFRLFSRLPLGFLYCIATALSVFLCYVLRYRRQVILDNLQRSFPDKSADELWLIAKGFYRNLADIVVETLKLPGMSADELLKRITFSNAESVRSKIKAGQTVVVMASHQANWEWVPAVFCLNGMPIDSVYKPLTNPFFENLVHTIRSRFGPFPTSMYSLPRQLAARKHIPRLIGLVSDQVPEKPEQAYWIDFLHQDTPFLPGGERLARTHNLPVVYIEMIRTGRGRYQLTFRPIAEPPYENLPVGAIVERYRDLLEDSLQIRPSDWLWSHKRWKHWRGKYSKIETKLA
ncbi:acetyltransferase [Spirosoma harenae]